MKNIPAIIATLLFGALLVWAASPTQVTITNASTSIPAKIVDSAGNSLAAKTFIFVDMNAAHTTNTSRVIIQRSPTNDVGGIPISPGEKIGIPVYTDRARAVDWWIDVETTGDGVIVIPIQ